MNRAEIKEAAKAKIKGNKWNIWWPYLLIAIIESVLTGLVGPKIDFTNLENLTTTTNLTVGQGVGMTVVAIFTGILTACYLKYIMNFVRTGKFDANVIIKAFKEKWLKLLVATIVEAILICLASILLVIPGIILAFAYAMVDYIILDTDLSAIDALKKSREMMRGYKWDFFVFALSFLGWCLLLIPTFGLLIIWLFPYMTVAIVMYYEKLKAKKAL